MFNIICIIALATKIGSISIVSNTNVEGKILKEGQAKYLVDFSEGVKKFNLAGKPSDYSKILIDKNQCVKE